MVQKGALHQHLASSYMYVHIYIHSKEVEEGTPSWLVAFLHFWLVTRLPWGGGVFFPWGTSHEE